MGFGGGGSGAFSLPNHLHTNALLAGGALDEAVSLINDGVGDVTFITWINAILAAKAPTRQRVVPGTNFSTTSLTLVDVTGYKITMPTVTNGKFLVNFVVNSHNTSLGAVNVYVLVDDVTAKQPQQVSCPAANYVLINTLSLTGTQSGQAIKLQMKVNAGAGTVNGTGDNVTVIESLEVS